jgi:type III secretion system FlhB-like substrate exporter
MKTILPDKPEIVSQIEIKVAEAVIVAARTAAIKIPKREQETRINLNRKITKLIPI